MQKYENLLKSNPKIDKILLKSNPKIDENLLKSNPKTKKAPLNRGAFLFALRL